MDAATPPALLQALARLAEQAGGAILAIRARGCATAHKGDGSPVTEADLAADAILAAGLAALVPGEPVVSEETVAAPLPDSATPFWLVDPLDGTREFVSGGDGFTVNVARVEQRRARIGAIHVPADGSTYVGAVGTGAWRRTGPHAPWTAIRCRPRPAEPLALVSLSHLDPETSAWLAREGVGRTARASSSLKFCRLAEGLADLYPRFGPTMEWDTAAGEAIAVAAGAAMTDLAGAPMLYGKQDSGFRNGGFILRGPDA